MLKKESCLLLLFLFFALSSCKSESSDFGRTEFFVYGINGANLADIDFTTPSEATSLSLKNVNLDWSQTYYSSLDSGTYTLCATNLTGSGQVEVMIVTDYKIYKNQSSTKACLTYSN